MKIYGIWGFTPYEGTDLIKLYSTKELANAALKSKDVLKDHERKGGYNHEQYEVEEHEVSEESS